MVTIAQLTAYAQAALTSRSVIAIPMAAIVLPAGCERWALDRQMEELATLRGTGTTVAANELFPR
jgi:hypothetical protein